MNKKSTKRALILSVLSLMICVAILIGTTFAWFTDSATTSTNVIQTGTLDIVLEYWNGTEWVDAESEDFRFVKGGEVADASTEILWEPGCTYQLPKIRLRNEGNLAAKVLLRIDGISGDAKLLDVIEFKNTITNIPASLLTGSQANVFKKFNNATIDIAYGTPDGDLLFEWNLMGKGKVSPNSGHTDTSAEFTVTAHMLEEAGNTYQNLSIDGVSITAIATQDVYEYDSYTREYDKNATYPDVAPALPTVLPAVGISAEDCTWEQITMISNAGKAAEYFNLGDTKNITLSDGKVVTMEIVALNADEKVDGSKAGITWLSKSIVATRTMNDAKTNSGGWGESDLRRWLQGDFYNMLAEDVRNSIVTVKKSYCVNNDDRGQYNNIEPVSEDNLWIPSLREVCPVDKSKEKNGADYYQYFTTDAHKTLVQREPLDGTSTWWLRTSEMNVAQAKFDIANVFPPYVQFGDSVSNGVHGVLFGFCC